MLRSYLHFYTSRTRRKTQGKERKQTMGINPFGREFHGIAKTEKSTMEVIDLKEALVAKKVEECLVAQLPFSQKILAGLHMYKRYGVKGFSLFCSKKSSLDGSCIWLATMEDDVAFTKITTNIYCKNSMENLDRLEHIMDTRFDWTRETAFVGTPSNILEVIKTVAKDKQGSFPIYSSMFMFILEKQVDLNRADIPPGVVVRKLSLADLDVVVNNWTYNHLAQKDTLKSQVAFAIFNGLGYCVSVQGQVAAWVIISRAGYLYMLTTLPKYQQRGFARLCMEAASRQIYQETGIKPFGFVDCDNKALQGLLAKMGFKRASPWSTDLFVHRPKIQEKDERIKTLQF